MQPLCTTLYAIHYNDYVHILICMSVKFTISAIRATAVLDDSVLRHIKYDSCNL